MEQQQSPPSGSGTTWAQLRESTSSRLKAASDKFNIKSLFLIHFSLSAWIMVGSYGGIGYLFHSSTLLVLLLFSIHQSSNCEAIAFVIFVEVSAMMLELSFLIFHSYLAVALFLVILHFLFRILAIYALFKEFHLRGGTDFYNALFGLPLRASAYDDLERPHLSVPPTSPSDYKMGGRSDMGLPR